MYIPVSGFLAVFEVKDATDSWSFDVTDVLVKIFRSSEIHQHALGVLVKFTNTPLYIYIVSN